MSAIILLGIILFKIVDCRHERKLKAQKNALILQRPVGTALDKESLDLSLAKLEAQENFENIVETVEDEKTAERKRAKGFLETAPQEMTIPSAMHSPSPIRESSSN
jgi:hypothetical protein